MDIPVTRTKILVPRRPATLLTRQRLLGLLHNLLDYKLTIVAAPAGYGKTSLLVDWAHHVELPVCWYALDALDRDFKRFIAHFVASISKRFPDFGKRSGALIQGAAADPDLDHLVTTIVNDAYEHIREHFALVLDDYHLVGDSEMIDGFLSRFVQGVDEICHLVLSSRTVVALPDLPLMVARSQVCGLGFEELAFRADEIQTLVFQNYHLTMPASAAEELAEETEGWITGLLLSTQTAWQGMADRVRLARVSSVGLYDYLAQQVLDQQPARVRDFLLHTSLLEEFNAELCEAVLGQGEDWQGLIDTVLQNNLFVLPVDDEGTWLRYHHLFRDFLRTRLAQERPDEPDRILRQLAAVYAEREEWEKAHQACRWLGNVEATADLIEQAGSPMVKSGRWVTLAEWIDDLPAETLSSRPGLLSLRGSVAAMLGEVQRGLPLLNQAEVIFRAAGDRPGLSRTLVRRETVYRLIGDYQASLADADEALALAEGEENLRAIWAEASKAKGLGLFGMGQSNEAVRWLVQSLAAYSALNDEQNEALLHMDLGMVHMNAGRYDQALEYYNRALDHWRKADNVAQRAHLLNSLGVLCHLKGDYERAGELLEEALVCAEQGGYVRIRALALSSIGDLYAALDAPDAALDAFHQARETARRIDYRFLLLYLDVAEVALARSKGDLNQARDLVASVGERARESGSNFQQGLWQLEAGQLALAEGDALRAVAHLKRAAHCFDDGGQRVEGIRAHLHLAVGYGATGNDRAALTHLEHAFHHASALEGQHALVIAGREATALLETVQSHPTIGHQVSQLLGQITQFEHDIPVLRRRLRRQATAVPFAPPQLTIQGLGNMQVRLDGRPVTEPEWQSRKLVRDLFFLLLAHPDGLTKGEMGVLLWPDASPAQVDLRFKNAIYRLRRALGRDVVLFDENVYRFNRALDYEYDVEVFLEKLAQARVANDPSDQITAYQTAIHLYKGSYLPEVEGTWAWPERERLWRAYVGATLELAEFRLAMGEYEATLEYCQRVLTMDPCLEAAHRLAMRAYATMGNRAAVARQFDVCQQVLLEEIHAPPSSQTEALYETLMR
jgi:LuxR family maltose regulon positive regulatory protein